MNSDLDIFPNFNDITPKDDAEEAQRLAAQLKAKAADRKPTLPASRTASPSPGRAESGPAPQVGSAPSARTTARESPFPPGELSQSELDQYVRKEVVIDKNGVPRQAGADTQEGKFIDGLRKLAEKNLYIFARAILGRHFLTKSLHKPVCDFLQKVPPARKLVLMPREHAKTAIVSGALPLHIVIQPAATNIYFPGLEGSECRILLCGETETMAKKNLRVLEEAHTGNRLLRALWPHRVWEQPRSQAKEWSSNALIFPRENEWPDQTIRAVGVGGAITGARPNVLIKDDLISFKASNSDTVMDEAIEWHKASRALLDTYEVESGLKSLEFLIGTRWAVFDLYSYIIDNDPSVEVISDKFHRIIRDGKILWPEKHTLETIEQLRNEHGSMFYLLYLNSAADPELVDFDLEQVREFKIVKGDVLFDEDSRDLKLEKRAKGTLDAAPEIKIKPGTRLTPTLMREMAGREMWFRAKYG